MMWAFKPIRAPAQAQPKTQTDFEVMHTAAAPPAPSAAIEESGQPGALLPKDE
jgi:hypothetical protein